MTPTVGARPVCLRTREGEVLTLDVEAVASAAGLRTCEWWESGGRWFVRIDRR